MQIERVADAGAEWDAFVEATPGASLGHASAWQRVLRNGYGLDSEYLAARDPAGAIAGVLPLVRFRTLRGRLLLVSLPFLDTAGVLAASPAAEAALLDAALARARETGAERLELRQLEPLSGGPPPDALNRVDLLLKLEASEPEQWSALPAKVRNQTRKATREGLSLIEAGPEQLLQAFYEPFRRNMRDLGSPVHARRFFGAAAEAFGPRLRLVCTQHAGQPIGGLVAIDFAGEVSVPWASTLREQRHRCPNHIIYWEALRWSIARGARIARFRPFAARQRHPRLQARLGRRRTTARMARLHARWTTARDRRTRLRGVARATLAAVDAAPARAHDAARPAHPPPTLELKPMFSFAARNESAYGRPRSSRPATARRNARACR